MDMVALTVLWSLVYKYSAGKTGKLKNKTAKKSFKLRNKRSTSLQIRDKDWKSRENFVQSCFVRKKSIFLGKNEWHQIVFIAYCFHREIKVPNLQLTKMSQIRDRIRLNSAAGQ